MHPPPLLGSSRGNMASISIQLVNVTVCNDKALAYFAELALREDQPNVVAVTESHLQGFHLNKVRRQLRTIGWKTFVTPAIAADEESIALDVEEQQKKRYHNSGGELLLCKPCLTVWGHYQAHDAQGYRSIVYRAQGFSILVVCAYFLPGIGLDQGANQTRCTALVTLIKEIAMEWIIVADWNREPVEVGNSMLARFLRGVVVAPDVPMTCRSTTEAGGRVLDFALVSCVLANLTSCTTDLDVPFKPHFLAVNFKIEVGYLPDQGQEVLVPDPIPFCQGPREAAYSWFGCYQEARDEIGDDNDFLSQWKLAKLPWSGHASLCMSRLYATFSNAAERFALVLDPNSTDAMRGRAWRAGTKTTTASLSCAPDHFFLKPDLTFWEKVGTRIRQVIGFLKHAHDNLVAGPLAAIEEHMKLLPEMWPRSCPILVDTYLGKVHKFSVAPSLPIGKWLLQTTGKILLRKISEVGNASRDSYAAFVAKACTANGASLGHTLVKTMVKDSTINYQQVDDAHSREQGVSIQERHHSRICKWAHSHWKVHSTSRHPNLQLAFDELQKALHVAPKPAPHRIATLRYVLKSCSVSAGQGPDHQILRHWAFLPDEGLRCLLLILGGMENGSLPIQALMVYVGLMPKPAGGERPIGLTAMLYRLLMRLKKAFLADWDDKFAGFWDDAVKGSSPLRAAILRSLRVEVAKILGYEAIGLLWDISAFFDEVDIALLIPLALSRGFCPWTLGLAVKVHMGPRAFKEGKYISSWFESSGCSILAGCVTSVSLTRALLYDVLDDMHRSCSPITLRTWVDDCFQLHTGPKDFVINHAFVAAQRFAQLISNKGLKISGKSTITASSQEIADELQAKLATCGLVLKSEASAKDLGVDFAGGGRRRIPVQQIRLLAAKKAGSMVSQLGKVTKQAKRLVITGVRPRFYGFAAMGSSPTTTFKMRAILGNAAGIRKPGGCATTAFFLADMEHQDPCLTFPLETIIEFAIAHAGSGMKLANAQAWSAKLPALEDRCRWGKVYGAMSAAMASLLDAGFDIPDIGKWHDPSGEQWIIDYSLPMAIPALRQVLGHFLQLGTWHKARNHTFGASLGLYPDLHPLKSQIQQARRKARWEELYFLQAIGQGSMDLFSEHSLIRTDEGQVLCRWCAAPVIGSPWQHIAWTCRHFSDMEEPAFLKSAELVTVAQAAAEEYPTLWLRGIPNLGLPCNPLNMDYQAMQASSDGLFYLDDLAEPLDVHDLILGGDGSGGEHTRDSRIRRCGFGLVAVNSESHAVVKMWYGSVPGAQSGYTAECTALLHALLRTNGNCLMVMDSMAVIRQFRKSPRSNLKHNGLLWQAIFNARDMRRQRGGGEITLTWISSHKSLEHSLNAGATPVQWAVNQIADALAGRGALEAALSPSHIEHVLNNAATAHRILTRLVRVAILSKPVDAGAERIRRCKPCGESKLQRVEKWARAAGHSLTAACRCVRCGLQINLAHSALALEGILAMPCVGSLRQDLLKHGGRNGEDCVLLLNNIEAHSSHALATSGALKLHFCVSCGCYGAERSYKLRQPCKHYPTKAGKAALAAIAAGRRPK